MARSKDSGSRFERVAFTPAVGSSDAGEGHLSRRTLVAGAAWSVPAVTLLAAAPAFAAVSGGSLSVSAPNGRVPASGAVPVTAVVKNSSGQPNAGTAVTFTGATGTSFTPVSATTDGSGTAVTQMDLGTPWAKPGSTVTVTAVSGSDTTSGSFSVLGSNVVVAGLGYSSVLAQSELVFPSPVVDAVAVGGENSWFMVLLANGAVWTKGSNNYGQLGDGSLTSRSTWAPVLGLTSGVKQIAAAAAVGFALLADGSVKAWGFNGNGAVGDGSLTNRWSPVQVYGLTSGVTQIAAAAATGFALLADGSVRAWGFNDAGQVGDGSLTNRWSPVQVSGLTSGVTQIASAGHTGFALLSDGSMRAWGFNGSGQVGDGSTTGRLTPVPVSGLTSAVKQIAAGLHTGYALLSDGSVKAWGLNGTGMVGDGSSTNRSSPVQVSGLTSGVTQVAGAGYNGFALLSDGSVKAWGFNSAGQVGDGSTADRLSPVSVSLPAGQVAQRLATNSTVSSTAMIVMKTS